MQDEIAPAMAFNSQSWHFVKKNMINSEHLVTSSGDLVENSGDLAASSGDLAEQRDSEGCLMTHHLEAPAVDDLDALNIVFRARLENFAAEPRTKRKLSQEAMQKAILAVYCDRYLTLNALAQLVQRDRDTLRKQHLNGMIKTQKLKLAFPATPNHPQQAYIANRTIVG
jgi:ATP-dependent DNA helicase RecG